MAGKSPTHIVWFVRSIEGRKKDLFTRIGAAWEHKSGKGLNVMMDLIPNVDGKIVILEKREQPEGEVMTADTDAPTYDSETGEIGS